MTRPTAQQLESLPWSEPEFVTSCDHFTSEHYCEYPDECECRLVFVGGSPDQWEGWSLRQIEESGGGYICMVHDFPREASIDERLRIIDLFPDTSKMERR